MRNDIKYPDFFARFYDVIYDQLRSGDDYDYFMRKILDAEGPVLEVGVGTGRFFMNALKNGADIYGIDISPSMISILKNKLTTNAHYRISVQDLCKLNLNKKFNLIIAPFRVFMHLLNLKEQTRALDSVYEHLEQGGMFIFDLFVPNLKMLYEGLDNIKDFEGEYAAGKSLKRFTSMNADLVNQISNVTFKFKWDEDDKEVTKEWKTKLRFFFRYEIEHLINQSKLRLDKIYGDFLENELNRDSLEFIVHCQKS